MNLRQGQWTAITLGLAVSALGQSDDRQLIDEARRTQAEMQPMQPVAAPQPASQTPAARTEPAARGVRPDSGGDTLAESEHAARTEIAIAQARLELILARRGLQRADMVLAARHAQRALLQLGQTTAAESAEELELQAEGILAKARQAGVDVEQVARQVRGEAAADPLPDDDLDREVRAAVRVGQRYDGPRVAELNSTPDPVDLRQQTLQEQLPEPDGYRPARALVDQAALDATERQRRAYQGVLDDVTRDSHVRALVAADEARVVPDGDVTYPADWPERVAGRAAYAGGQIARSESWTDANGVEWFAAVYDVSDLTYVPPNFESGFVYNAHAALRDWQDRIALRERSFIFGGFPHDLAAGIPLLHYFGGVGGERGYYSVREQEQLAELVRAFGGDHADAKVISLPPINR